jgi:glycosyltransferase involved in cell wall biosynthesis
MKKVIHIALQHRSDSTRIFHRECKALSSAYDVTYIGLGIEQVHEMRDGVHIMQEKRSSVFKLFFQYLRILWNRPADVYHCHEPEGIFLLLLLKLRRPKVKLIFDVHEYFEYGVTNKNKKWYVRGYYYFFILFMRPVLLKFFDAAICVTEPMSKIYERFVPEVYTVHNYPDTLTFANIESNQQLPEASCYLVHHGRNISTERGLYNYLSLLAEMIKKYPDTKLLLIGRIIKSEIETYEEFIRKNNLVNSIIATGPLSHHKAIGYLKNNVPMIGVFLAEDVGQMSRSVPVKSYEWLALGIPQICSEHIVNITSNILSSGGGIGVMPHDIDGQVGAVESILKDYTLYKRKALDLSKIYNWLSESKNLSMLYKKILD